MTVYVVRDGKLIVKPSRAVPAARDGPFSPRISRIEPFESPISGKEITSWGERDREMRAFDCFDTRDLPRDHSFKRGREAQSKELSDGRPGQSLWRERDR
jgi:hypothetical protein